MMRKRVSGMDWEGMGWRAGSAVRVVEGEVKSEKEEYEGQKKGWGGVGVGEQKPFDLGKLTAKLIPFASHQWVL